MGELILWFVSHWYNNDLKLHFDITPFLKRRPQDELKMQALPRVILYLSHPGPRGSNLFC